ncbi:MAG: hypothetical protein IPP97_11630 [Candidatus Obscuribacter sp.]|nr:hypothetical protein [Candidatus Obscuribacter sp.]
MTSGKPNTTSGSNRNNAQAAKAAQQSGVSVPASITPATSGKRGKREQIVKAAVKIFLEKRLCRHQHECSSGRSWSDQSHDL